MNVGELTDPGRCVIMGIVNVTEDSFSDGGQYLRIDDAIKHAHALIQQGADIIDVGGESTRPGAVRVPGEVELSRVVPVLKELNDAHIRTSVDTMRASVARAAAEAGVSMINDVSGGMADPDMLSVMAEADIPVCLMHWKTVRFGDASGRAEYHGDVVKDVQARLDELVAQAIDAGVAADQIVLDPGLGFAKSKEDNWALLHSLPSFINGPFPILVGASRKRFLAQIPQDRGVDVSPIDIDPASAAVTAIAAFMGAWGVRVHSVVPSRDAVDVVAAWQYGGVQHG